jgi:single-stranded-DNA-specific exonuclease
LIISLDCGIRAVDKIAYANSLGIDFIVCDHHHPGEELPVAIILDPMQKECSYPYKGLSGCVVGFKLLQALQQTNNWDAQLLLDQLDLVAISIGADIVPITEGKPHFMLPRVTKTKCFATQRCRGFIANSKQTITFSN